MPNVFKFSSYSIGKQKVGDVVYLAGQPEIPMTVTELPHCNTTAGHSQQVLVAWFTPNGDLRRGEFKAEELSR